MCGILGYTGKSPANVDDLKILFLYSQKRGTHASGYGSLNGGVVKSNDSSPYFIATNKLPETNLFIGHTRSPSGGQGREVFNAQPFDFDNIIGLHNGYISNYYSIKTRLQTDKKYSDSYHALKYIDIEGAEKAIPKIRGNMALAWINKKDETLSLYRDGNPIFIGKKDGGFYFSSEKDFLIAIETTDIKSIKEEHLFTFKGTELIESKKLKSATFTTPSRTTNNERKSNYGKDHIKNYNNETKTNGVIKLKPISAPDNAKPIFHKGFINYYWLEDSVLYIEQLKTATSSQKFTYDLKYGERYNEAEKQFKPIMDIVNK